MNNGGYWRGTKALGVENGESILLRRDYRYGAKCGITKELEEQAMVDAQKALKEQLSEEIRRVTSGTVEGCTSTAADTDTRSTQEIVDSIDKAHAELMAIGDRMASPKQIKELERISRVLCGDCYFSNLEKLTKGDPRLEKRHFPRGKAFRKLWKQYLSRKNSFTPRYTFDSLLSRAVDPIINFNAV